MYRVNKLPGEFSPKETNVCEENVQGESLAGSIKSKENNWPGGKCPGEITSQENKVPVEESLGGISKKSGGKISQGTNWLGR